VTIQTRSPLVTRDLDLFRGAADLEVGLSVTTADDGIRRLFEPHAPPIGARLAALGELHRAGVRTYAMVAPILPGAEGLGELLVDRVDHLLVDRLNYHHADWLYRRHGLEDGLTDEFFRRTARGLATARAASGIPCRVVY